MQRTIDGIIKLPPKKLEPREHRTKTLVRAWLKIFLAIVKRVLLKFRKYWAVAALVILILAISLFILLKSGLERGRSPIPQSISNSVSFPVYYPDPKKLPTGYVLSPESFRVPQKDVVLYSVNYGKDKKLVFSVQPKPSDTYINNFHANYIPLHSDFQTSIGKAEIGAYNNTGNLQTLVSMPADDRIWIVITAPADIDQNQLKQVLRSIMKQP